MAKAIVGDQEELALQISSQFEERVDRALRLTVSELAEDNEIQPFVTSIPDLPTLHETLSNPEEISVLTLNAIPCLREDLAARFPAPRSKHCSFG